MARIRKTTSTGGPKKIRSKQIEQQQPQAKVESFQDIKADLDKAVAKGVGKAEWLSADEAKGLIARAQAAGPDVAAKLKTELAGAMNSGQLGGKDLKVGDAALKAIAAFSGVAAGTFREVTRSVDKEAEHTLGEGLAKTKASISDDESRATQKEINDLEFASRNGTAVSAKEFTPHYKAAKALGGELKKAMDAHLEENAPEAKAAIDTMAPQVEGMIQNTAAQLAKDPEAMKRVANVVAKVGEEGFTQAIKDVAPSVGSAFTAATGVPAVNKDVVGKLLSGAQKMAAKYAPEAAPKVAATCANIGGKLGVEVAKTAAKETAGAVVKEGAKAVAKEGAEAAAKAALKAGGKAAAKEGAEAVAKAGAKAAAKTAATGGKAVPGLGNVISVGSACFAAVGFVKSLFASPKDGESIAKNGLNTLLQTVGIAFPWAGLAGDLIDMGWSAKKAVTDTKAGKEPEQGLTKKDAADLVGTPARLLAAALDGAGKGSVAKSFRDLADATEAGADSKVLEKAQMGAISQFSQMSSQEVTKAAAQEEDPATRDALNVVAHGFGELFKVCYGHKRLKGEDGIKRDELKGNLVRITGDVAVAAAALAMGGKDASIDDVG